MLCDATGRDRRNGENTSFILFVVLGRVPIWPTFTSHLNVSFHENEQSLEHLNVLFFPAGAWPGRVISHSRDSPPNLVLSDGCPSVGWPTSCASRRGWGWKTSEDSPFRLVRKWTRWRRGESEAPRRARWLGLSRCAPNFSSFKLSIFVGSRCFAVIEVPSPIEKQTRRRPRGEARRGTASENQRSQLNIKCQIVVEW